MISEADRLLARLLEHNGLVPQEQLDECLRAVEKATALGLALRLDDVLLDKQLLDRNTLAAARKLPVRETDVAIKKSGRPPLEPADAEHRRIGNLALRNGLLTPEALDAALAAQAATAADGGPRLALGDILVARGSLTPDLVKSLLEFQRALAGRAAAKAGPALLQQQDLFFGSIAMARGILTQEGVRQAITLQRQVFERTGIRRRLGEVMIDAGLLDARQVETVLEEQRRKRQVEQGTTIVNPQLPEDRENRLGRVIVDNQLVTEDQIQECLEVQARLRELGIKRKIGEILVLKGYLDAAAISTMVGLQTERRQKSGGRPRRRRRGPQGSVVGVVAAVAVLLAIAGIVAAKRGGGGAAGGTALRPPPSPAPTPTPVPAPTTGGGAVSPGGHLLVRFEQPGEFALWTAVGSTCERAAGAGEVNGGAGALRWTVPGGARAALETTAVPAGLGKGARLGFWLRAQSGDSPTLRVRLGAGDGDCLEGTITPAGTAWRRYELALAEMTPTGRPDPARLARLSIGCETAAGAAPVVLWIDDLSLGE